MKLVFNDQCYIIIYVVIIIGDKIPLMSEFQINGITYLDILFCSAGPQSIAQLFGLAKQKYVPFRSKKLIWTDFQPISVNDDFQFIQNSKKKVQNGGTKCEASPSGSYDTFLFGYEI